MSTTDTGTNGSSTASFASIAEFADAMRRAEAAHGVHEQRIGKRDDDWPTWYASFMVAEQAGTPLPE